MKRLLIEDWLPIEALGVESLRERTPMTPFPAPNRLHVWFARRPLVASRAAVLASLLPADASREMFSHLLGIHGDPMASRRRIDAAKHSGERFEGQAYTYPRAFTYQPTVDELAWLGKLRGGSTVLDPTAGGGSVPFEAVRLGCDVIANDLNAVAALILRATVEFPLLLGGPLLARYSALAAEFVRRRDKILDPIIPPEPVQGAIATNWLWARTITCPYCGGSVPLSPTWALSSDGTGVKLTANATARQCCFEIVTRVSEHSKATIRAGAAECPFPDCGRVIDGEEVKAQAQVGRMGHQLYAVVFRFEQVVGHTKTGKARVKRQRGFRAPRSEDDVQALVEARLLESMPEWLARNIIPDEEIGSLSNYDRGHRLYGIHRWREMFSPRQLFGH